MSYYSVHKGYNAGIFNTWDECKKNINGFKGAIYKKFNNKEDAEYFLLCGKIKEKNIIVKDGINIYTDGSLFRLNYKCYSGYGIYIPSMDIKKSYILPDPKTNNRAELTAIINSIKEHDLLDKNINIITDSTYCIHIMTTTGKKYKEQKYKDTKGEDVKNKDLVIEANNILDKYIIEMIHINSHTTNESEHYIGNKIADKLAVRGAVTDYINSVEKMDDYVIRFGKYKGQILNDIKKETLIKYISTFKYKQTCISNENYMIEREIIKNFIGK